MVTPLVVTDIALEVPRDSSSGSDYSLRGDVGRRSPTLLDDLLERGEMAARRAR